MSSSLALSATRHGAFVERIRKPLSAAFFIAWLAWAVFTQSPGEGIVWTREAMEFSGYLLLPSVASGPSPTSVAAKTANSAKTAPTPSPATPSTFSPS
jgi:hypothetical protein